MRFDCDVLLHRYCTKDHFKGKDRNTQCLMFVEVKTYDAEPTDAQRDTLGMFSQVLRNRKRNMHQQKLGRHADDHVPPCKVHSHILRKRVELHMFGGHLLQLSGVDPPSSDRIRWDYKEVDAKRLLMLLRFELDPDTLRPMDLRTRNGSKKKYQMLF